MKAFFAHLFVPRHTNNFKPRILHVPAFLTYAIFFIALNLSFQTIHAINPDILGFATNITIDRLIELTNQQRTSAGLSPLIYNQQLAQAAAGKAQDMFGENYWAHNSPSGKTPWDFIVGAGYRYIYAGENLAKNFQDSDSVVSAWMASPSHRENILRGQYSEVGFAIVNGTLNGEETTLVVQMFGTTQKQAAVIEGVQAAEPPAEVAGIEEESTKEIIPTTELAQVSDTTTSLTEIELLPQSSVVQEPKVDSFGALKTTSIVVSIIVMVTLIIDGIYVWRKKIVRISGRSLAHIMFLTAITGSIWLVSSGIIL